mmetsp:Transcript_30175/g.69179  ORF Transcript_30175/g.69179 Transcript_30175/m.69179 type:complete len:85 (+) Transcript_30175:419-673(+)
MWEHDYDWMRSRKQGAWATKHLRDTVALEMCPTDLKTRRRVTADVWPRVVVEVRADSRVRQVMRQDSGGAVEEYWEWLAVEDSQ